jgi:hypothetical protein
MTRSLARNAITDPAVAQRIRDRIAGKPLPPAEKPKGKRAEPVKCYVSQFHKFDPRNNSHTIQLPIAFRTAEYNADHTPMHLKAKWVKEKRDYVWLAFDAYFPQFRTDAAERARVRNIEFVRIGLKRLDDDNIVAAFKAVRDATCSYLVWGAFAREHVKAIGSADDKLWKDGIRWTYRQQQCESNPRLYGIRIILHCAPRSPEP